MLRTVVERGNVFVASDCALKICLGSVFLLALLELALGLAAALVNMPILSAHCVREVVISSQEYL